ncbi:MAG: sporulation protein YunB [Bacillota bacterium]
MRKELLIILSRRLFNKRRRLKWHLVALAGLCSAFFLFLSVEKNMIPTLIAISESQVTAIANEALRQAIDSHVDALLSGKKLLDFHTGPEGDLLYVQTNTSDLNRIQSEALAILQQAIADLEGFEISIPLGQALSSKIFAAKGPKIKVAMFPYGHVNVQVVDTFEVTGINQIKYGLDLRVTYTVQVVVPLISSKTHVSMDIPLATVLIPGRVPDTYLMFPYGPK